MKSYLAMSWILTVWPVKYQNHRKTEFWKEYSRFQFLVFNGYSKHAYAKQLKFFLLEFAAVEVFTFSEYLLILFQFSIP